MATKPRRPRGEGSIYWDENRQRFIAEITIGYTPAGKRIVRKGSGKTETAARAKLKELVRDHDDGLAIAPPNFTVGDAVTDWLAFGLNGRSTNTRSNYRNLAETHIIGQIGARKLRDLNASDVERWLAKPRQTSQQPNVAPSTFDPQSSAQASDGPGQGETQRCRALRRTLRAIRPSVEVAHPRPSEGRSGSVRTESASRLHRGVTSHRRAYRGTTCACLGARRPRRAARREAARSAFNRGVAFSARYG